MLGKQPRGGALRTTSFNQGLQQKDSFNGLINKSKKHIGNNKQVSFMLDDKVANENYANDSRLVNP